MTSTQPPIQWAPVFFPEVNLSGRELYHWTTPSVEVKNKCSEASTSPNRLHGVKRDNFILLPLARYETDDKMNSVYTTNEEI